MNIQGINNVKENVENRKSLIFNIAVHMGVHQLGVDINNVDFQNIKKDLERKKVTISQVITLANAAFYMETIEPYFYARVLTFAISLDDQRETSFYLLDQDHAILAEIQKEYKLGAYAPTNGLGVALFLEECFKNF